MNRIASRSMVLVMVLVMLVSGAGAALAQAPQIGAIWPPGGPAGAKVDARVEGGNLAGASQVMVSGSGVAAKIGAANKEGNSLPLTLEIAKDAQPGAREIRILTPKGGSNPGYVWVGSLPEVAETEPNDQLEKAMALSNLPLTVYARIGGAEDVDWYSFQAAAGDTFVFDICANRLFAPLDAFLELRDSEGRLLAQGMEGYDRDPRIIYTFKAAGLYRLQVRDTLYRGGQGYVYRLSAGKIPTVISYFPPGGRRGQPLKLEFTGANLGGAASATIALPASMSRNSRWLYSLNTPAGPALPIILSGDDNPQMTDAFPPTPSPVVVNTQPVTINGRISNQKEADNFTFAAEKGKPTLIHVHARDIGSRLDAYLRVFDSAGKDLLNSEEQIGRDARLVFNPPATAAYRLQVTSLDNHGGYDYYYRITLGPPGPPDIRLSVSPDMPSAGRGQTAAVAVNISRLGGYNGPIEVTAEGLPAGIKGGRIIMGPGQTTGSLTLSAPVDGPLGCAPIHIFAAAALDGRSRATRPAGVVANLPRPGEGKVAARPVEFMAFAATADIPIFSLTLERDSVELAPGQTLELKVQTRRRPADNAANPAIALSFANLPPGVTAETPNIPEKAGEVTIKLKAAPDARPVVQSANLSGKLGENTQPAPALLVTVKQK